VTATDVDDKLFTRRQTAEITYRWRRRVDILCRRAGRTITRSPRHVRWPPPRSVYRGNPARAQSQLTHADISDPCKRAPGGLGAGERDDNFGLPGTGSTRSRRCRGMGQIPATAATTTRLRCGSDEPPGFARPRAQWRVRPVSGPGALALLFAGYATKNLIFKDVPIRIIDEDVRPLTWRKCASPSEPSNLSVGEMTRR